MNPSTFVTKRDIVQALAEMSPWVYDERLNAKCFFCGVEKRDGKTSLEAHGGDCLWVQAIRYRNRTAK